MQQALESVLCHNKSNAAHQEFEHNTNLGPRISAWAHRQTVAHMIYKDACVA